MQQQVHLMMAGRVQLKKLAVEGVRQPSHGVPVGFIVGSKGPLRRSANSDQIEWRNSW